MNILFVSAFLPALGVSAGAARAFEVIRGASRNHQVDILSFVDSQDERRHTSALDPISRTVDTIIRRRTPDAGDIFGMQPRQFVTEYSDPVMAAAIRERVSGGTYDLVQFEFLQAAWLFPKECPIPSILTHHEVQHSSHLQRMRLSSSLLDKPGTLSRGCVCFTGNLKSVRALAR